MKPHAYLFADGSSSKNDDIGGWAAVAALETQHKVLYGMQAPTTISRCELIPIIEGLRWIKRNWRRGTNYSVHVYSDSEYTVKALSGIYRPKKNEELWAAVKQAEDGMIVKYFWRARNTLPYMTTCDAICGAVRRSVIKMMSNCFTDPRAPENDIPKGALPHLYEEENEDTTYG